MEIDTQTGEVSVYGRYYKEDEERDEPSTAPLATLPLQLLAEAKKKNYMDILSEPLDQFFFEVWNKAAKTNPWFNY